MDIYTKFNRKEIDDRQIDTMIGLCKGIIADNNVNQAEAEALLQWLSEARKVTEHPIIVNLLEKVCDMLADNTLDSDESEELLALLRKVGERSDFGEMFKTSSLPINQPAPVIEFEGRFFSFTGSFAYGNRDQCHVATTARGGIIAKNVTNSLDYLVLGTYVTDSWVHETFGRKIEKAMQYRTGGCELAIVTEDHWINSGNIGE